MFSALRSEIGSCASTEHPKRRVDYQQRAHQSTHTKTSQVSMSNLFTIIVGIILGQPCRCHPAWPRPDNSPYCAGSLQPRPTSRTTRHDSSKQWPDLPSRHDNEIGPPYACPAGERLAKANCVRPTVSQQGFTLLIGIRDDAVVLIEEFETVLVASQSSSLLPASQLACRLISQECHRLSSHPLWSLGALALRLWRSSEGRRPRLWLRDNRLDRRMANPTIVRLLRWIAAKCH